MTTTIDRPIAHTATRARAHDIWRIVRLHALKPSVFAGVPLTILGGAWAVSLIVGVILRQAGGVGDIDGMRYSWAVLSPQWYLAVVGVQVVGLTFSFALGFGATRRDFWLGSSLVFVLASAAFAVLIATLVQVEIATSGWGLGVHMFDALWYGSDWWLDFYTTFALQCLVLFIGASVTTVYMRWRIRGIVIIAFAAIALVLAAVAIVTGTASWPSVGAWFVGLSIAQVFSLILAVAAFFAVAGYVVIRRATPR
ncbi:hypothetical protein E6C70_11135 [Glaciibacter flavus]|uniref:Uncharacterized protein n=1 Tax=Orlajensenia flava TaxID=2565934 RepID=A0A4S4FVC7_9MICO|nr:hypothetical protein [Glaciibacter flavus]THG33972.1 hypothetical protein E6C70_11135 [Glaciibacter flavus]